jgi:hypothetical protein
VDATFGAFGIDAVYAPGALAKIFRAACASPISFP